MAIAWILTLPAAGIVGAAAAWVASSGTVGTVVVAVVGVAVAAGIYAASRRRPVTAENVNDVPAPQPAAQPVRLAA
jgi:PiT family inorganic phosphate transporter